ncbi:MAG: hypothetical protein HYU36_01195 [Planctomycetes bacterium]|nr:hypothetical protein [Planctomycetota bacterium]
MRSDRRKTRGTFDLTMRHLARSFPKDMALLSLGRKADRVRTLSPDLPSTERRADWLAKATVGHETALLQVEFQTRYESSKVLDSLDYRVQARRQYRLPVFSVFIYLTSRGYPGPGQNRLEETVFGQRQLLFEWSEVRLWELKAAEMLQLGASGLIPLVALARGKTPEQPLTLAVDAASKVSDNSAKANILTAIGVLASLRYPKDLIFSFIRREAMKESSVAMDFIREGLKEGLKKGRQEGRQKGRQEGRQEGRQKGRQEGRREGELIGEIRTWQRFLGQPITSRTQLEKMSLENLREMAGRLKKEEISHRK